MPVFGVNERSRRVKVQWTFKKANRNADGLGKKMKSSIEGYLFNIPKGDQAFFGGRTTQEMKNKLGVPSNRPLADFLSNLLIRGKAFATELTSHNVVENDLMGDKAITEEHIINNAEVRNILLKRGVKPEELPSSEDVKKVKRRLDKVEKRLLKDAKKYKKDR